MRLVAIADDGTEFELHEVSGIDKDADLIIMKLLTSRRGEEIERVEQYLTEKLGKRVVFIPPWIGEVMTLKDR